MYEGRYTCARGKRDVGERGGEKWVLKNVASYAHRYVLPQLCVQTEELWQLHTPL